MWCWSRLTSTLSTTLTKRLCLLLMILAFLVGGTMMPKLYWEFRQVVMTCPQMEHAIEVLNDLEADLRDGVDEVCAPGEPQCIAEAWMTWESKDLRLFLEGMHLVACQSL